MCPMRANTGASVRFGWRATRFHQASRHFSWANPVSSLGAVSTQLELLQIDELHQGHQPSDPGGKMIQTPFWKVDELSLGSHHKKNFKGGAERLIQSVGATLHSPDSGAWSNHVKPFPAWASGLIRPVPTCSGPVWCLSTEGTVRG